MKSLHEAWKELPDHEKEQLRNAGQLATEASRRGVERPFGVNKRDREHLEGRNRRERLKREAMELARSAVQGAVTQSLALTQGEPDPVHQALVAVQQPVESAIVEYF